MFYFMKREPTCKCIKCGLEYQKKEYICPYCRGKNNAQIIRDIHIPHANQLRETSKVGRYFIYLTIIIGGLFLLIS